MYTVSVIIPTYNREKYIEETILSVLHQSFPVHELIIIDDGSTDNTRDVVGRYKDRHEVKYVYQQNQGISSARNHGVRLATGNILAFLDSDDIWLPSKLSLQMELFRTSPLLGMVHNRIGFIDSHGRTCKGPSEGWAPDVSGKCFFRMVDSCLVHTSAAAIRREVFDSVGLFDENLRTSEDYEFFLRVTHRYEVGFVDQVLSLYRVHEEGVTRDKNRLDLDRIRSLALFEGKTPLERAASRAIGTAKADVYCRLAARAMQAEGWSAVPYVYLMKAIVLNPLRVRPYELLLGSFVPRSVAKNCRWYARKVLGLLRG